MASRPMRPPGGSLDRVALRRRALKVGRTVLDAEGLPGLTVRRIAAELGCAAGTIYNLFDDFDDLVLELNLATLREAEAAHAASPPPPEATPVQAARHVALVYHGVTRQHAGRWQAVMRFAPQVTQRGGQELGKVLARRIAHLERTMVPLMPGGHRRAERRLAATVLWTSLEGIVALHAARNVARLTPASAETMLDVLLDNFFAGLAACQVQTARAPGRGSVGGAATKS